MSGISPGYQVGEGANLEAWPNQPPVGSLALEYLAADPGAAPDQGCAAHGLAHPCEACAVASGFDQVLDAFERRERGIPQAHMAAALAAELRGALLADAGGVDLPEGGRR
jgi:hypothetical protein